MSNIKDNYRIVVKDIVDKGIQQVEFDPSKVKRLDDMEWIGDWDNDGEYRICYMYEDKELALMMSDLNYSLNWNKDLPFTNGDQQQSRSIKTGIRLVRTSCVKLRKKRGESGYTDKSLKAHEEAKEKLKLEYNVDAVTNMYRRLIEDFNAWYRDEQIEKVSKAYGNVYAWQVDEHEEIDTMSKEIEELEEKANQLRQKRFDKRCELVVNYIENKEEPIADDFVQPILEVVNKYKNEGYKSPFLRMS